MVISSDCGFWRGSKSWNRFVYFCQLSVYFFCIFCLYTFFETALEQLIQKLMEEDGNPQSVIWRHPLMTYSKDPISTSLTTFTSEELQNEALKLFKVMKLDFLRLLTVLRFTYFNKSCHFLVCASYYVM